MIEAVVAVYGDWGIGANGTQPVVVAADRKHFREITGGSAVLVGRKTLADFPGGKPLKNRTNIVLTRQELDIPGAVFVHSEAEALAECQAYDRVFVIGGASVYRAFIPHIQRVHVTKLDCVPHSDAFFPNLDADPDWEVESEGPVQTDENGVSYRFMTYVRRLSPELQAALDWMNDTDPLTRMGGIFPIRRRSARLLSRSDRGLTFYDDFSHISYAFGEVDTLPEGFGQGSRVFITDSAESAAQIAERFGLGDVHDYDQVCYLHDAPPAGGIGNLRIARPTDAEMARINADYDLAEMPELQRDRARGDLFAAHDAQEHFVGYMGIHADGSMGLLKVFPEYRRLGYAEEFERFIMTTVLSRGYQPFAQIAPDNTASMHLQLKLGCVKAPGRIWFLW